MRASIPRSRLIVLAVAVTCGCSGAAGRLPALDAAELAARGRDDYLRSCAPCHGADGRGGDAGRAPDLTRLREQMGSGFSHEYIVDVITGERDVPAHGPREMPVWQDRFGDSGAEAAAALWTRRRVDALAAHVESLQVDARASDQR